MHVFRGDQHVLKGLSFSAAAGCCLRIVGSNGSGKTSLLRAVCGLLEVESGLICWKGRDIAEDRATFNADMSYLGHDLALKMDLTVQENLYYGVGMRRAVSAAGLRAALQRLGVASMAERPLRSLSTGQRRRVAFAALWLTGSSLWVLDEPNTNLDVAGQDMVAGLIEEQLSAGGVVLAALHQDLPLRCGSVATLSLGSLGNAA